MQSAVRLLVIIFQSVTLVSALWRCEEERGQRPWLAGWMAEAEWVRRSAVGTVCVFVLACVCVWIQVVGRRYALLAVF